MYEGIFLSKCIIMVLLQCILSTGLCVSMYLCFKLCIRGLAVRVLLNTVLDINASVIQAGFYVMGM